MFKSGMISDCFLVLSGLRRKKHGEHTEQSQYAHHVGYVPFHAGNLLPAPVELQVKSIVMAV